MTELDQQLQEDIALRFGREYADDIRDLILDAEERHTAIGFSAQRRQQFEMELGRQIWKAWNRFRNAAVEI
jgi:hypothetical protein